MTGLFEKKKTTGLSLLSERKIEGVGGARLYLYPDIHVFLYKKVSERFRAKLS